MNNPLVRLLFNRGGFGQSMSRAETIEHVNPILEQHTRLNRCYNQVIDALSDDEIASELQAAQKTARADVGKLAETVLSAGGTAYNGVDLRGVTFDLGETETDMLFALRDREQALHDAVTDDLDENHQMRTRAILEVVQANSAERLDYLKGVTKRRHRRTPTS
jgi:uncharacterized protein (DUF697 family)